MSLTRTSFIALRLRQLLVWAAVTIVLLTTSLSGQQRQLEAGTPEGVGMSAGRLQRLDVVIESAISDGAAPGAAVLVARNGRIVYQKAYGLRAVSPAREALSIDTVFDMASLTKVMATAPAVMILVEEGRLSLADRAVRHIPEFSSPETDRITVRQMLTHYSGLRPDIDLDQPWSSYAEGIRRGSLERPVAPPGSRFLYSDINFFLLAEIVARVSGQSFDQFCLERIYRPLGMSSTQFNPPDSWNQRTAPTEVKEGAMLRGTVHDPTARRMEGVAGHAGLFSTIRDTAIYAEMLLNGGVYGSARILSPLSVRLLGTNQSPEGMRDWRGLGFDIRTPFSSNRGELFPVGSFGHTGFTGTSVWVDPGSGVFVLLFTSRLHPDGGGGVVALRRRVATVVASAIEDLPSSPGQGKNSLFLRCASVVQFARLICGQILS